MELNKKGLLLARQQNLRMTVADLFLLPEEAREFRTLAVKLPTGNWMHCNLKDPIGTNTVDFMRSSLKFAQFHYKPDYPHLANAWGDIKDRHRHGIFGRRK